MVKFYKFTISPNSMASARILLVDDTKDFAQLFAEGLAAHANRAVDLTDSLPEAQAMILAGSDYRALVIDPYAYGATFGKSEPEAELKPLLGLARARSFPVVVLSASFPDALEQVCGIRSEEYSAAVSKVISPRQFLERLQQVPGYR
jgi:CheY-like chemotaxis protein